MTIEVNHYSKHEQQEIQSIMDRNGFELIKMLHNLDFVFKRKVWHE